MPKPSWRSSSAILGTGKLVVGGRLPSQSGGQDGFDAQAVLAFVLRNP